MKSRATELVAAAAVAASTAGGAVAAAMPPPADDVGGVCGCPGGDWTIGTFDHPNAQTKGFSSPPPLVYPTMSIGRNVDEAGARLVTTQPAVWDTWEADYVNGADDAGEPVRWFLRKMRFAGSDGSVFAPLSLAMTERWNDPRIDVSGKFTVFDRTGASARLTVLDEQVGSPSAMLLGTKNETTSARCMRPGDRCLEQLKQDGKTSAQLIHLDSFDRVRIGAQATAIRFDAGDRPVVSGVTAEERVDSLIDALVQLGLVARQ